MNSYFFIIQVNVSQMIHGALTSTTFIDAGMDIL